MIRFDFERVASEGQEAVLSTVPEPYKHDVEYWFQSKPPGMTSLTLTGKHNEKFLTKIGKSRSKKSLVDFLNNIQVVAGCPDLAGFCIVDCPGLNCTDMSSTEEETVNSLMEAADVVMIVIDAKKAFCGEQTEYMKLATRSSNTFGREKQLIAVFTHMDELEFPEDPEDVDDDVDVRADLDKLLEGFSGDTYFVSMGKKLGYGIHTENGLRNWLVNGEFCKRVARAKFRNTAGLFLRDALIPLYGHFEPRATELGGDFQEEVLRQISLHCDNVTNRVQECLANYHTLVEEYSEGVPCMGVLPPCQLDAKALSINPMSAQDLEEVFRRLFSEFVVDAFLLRCRHGLSQMLDKTSTELSTALRYIHTTSSEADVSFIPARFSSDFEEELLDASRPILESRIAYICSTDLVSRSLSDDLLEFGTFACSALAGVATGGPVSFMACVLVGCGIHRELSEIRQDNQITRCQELFKDLHASMDAECAKVFGKIVSKKMARESSSWVDQYQREVFAAFEVITRDHGRFLDQPLFHSDALTGFAQAEAEIYARVSDLRERVDQFPELFAMLEQSHRAILEVLANDKAELKLSVQQRLNAILDEFLAIY